MNKEQIKEINQHISDALMQWTNVMNTADADEWAYFLEYNDEDLFNALYIFNHVAQNICIKNGVFNKTNATPKMLKMRDAIKEVYEFDTVELTNKIMDKYNENKETT